MALIGLMGVAGLIAMTETKLLQRRMAKSGGAVVTQSSPKLKDGQELLRGADGVIHRPGCPAIAPPVSVLVYRNAESEGRRFCPECLGRNNNPEGMEE